MADQRLISRAFRAALGHHNTSGHGNKQGRNLRDEPITHGQHSEIGDSITKAHAVAADAYGNAANQIDRRDDQTSNGIAAHKFRSTVHGAVKTSFRFQFLAPRTGLRFINQPGGQIRINRHLLARHGIQAEARGNFSNSPAALGNDNKIDNQQDEENNQPDGNITAHQEAAKGRNHMAGRFWPFMPMRQNNACCGNIQRKT